MISTPASTTTADKSRRRAAEFVNGCGRAALLLVLRRVKSVHTSSRYGPRSPLCSGASLTTLTLQDEDPAVLHSRVPFILSSTLRDPSSSTSYFAPVDVAALDAELIYTTSGMSLARLTVLSASGSVLLDEHVRPPSSSTVLDLNTRFSGVKAGEVESAVLDVAGVRRALAQFVDEKTILIGHGLENDLKALRIVHKQVIDTAIVRTPVSLLPTALPFFSC